MARGYIVMTAVGDDRPGLVQSVSEFVLDRGGNVEATRAATLGGEFAMILLISGQTDAVEAIGADAAALESAAGLIVTVKPTGAPAEHPAEIETLPYNLTVHSMDHPGIVQAVTHHLAADGVNIRSLDTHVESAPHTGTAFFHFHAHLDIPADRNIAKFRAQLEELAERLNIDIQLAAAED